MTIVTLTTDFGYSDWFVGAMKGVILSLAPRAQVVDITHAVPPGDIRAGAFMLAGSYRFFPEKTVHVAVVDPGVGGPRKAIAVQTADYVFVGPDNGVLSLALAGEKVRAVHRLKNEKLFLKPVSGTFHGRDVFAPVAARLCQGLPIRKVGPAMKTIMKIDLPKPAHRPDSILGEIIYLDRFGNAITNIAAGAMNPPFRRRRPQSAEPGDTTIVRLSPPARAPLGLNWEVWVKRKRLCALQSFYAAVPPGKPVAVPGSSGFLEIAVNGGSAARIYGLKIGETVLLRHAPPQKASSSSS